VNLKYFSSWRKKELKQKEVSCHSIHLLSSCPCRPFIVLISLGNVYICRYICIKNVSTSQNYRQDWKMKKNFFSISWSKTNDQASKASCCWPHSPQIVENKIWKVQTTQALSAGQMDDWNLEKKKSFSVLLKLAAWTRLTNGCILIGQVCRKSLPRMSRTGLPDGFHIFKPNLQFWHIL
jgi:hypothetical protein